MSDLVNVELNLNAIQLSTWEKVELREDGSIAIVGYGRLDEVDVDVMKSAVKQLCGAMAAKTDNVLIEAVTRFLGRDNWTLGELKGRGELKQLPSGIEEFSIDGVVLVELYPVTGEHVQGVKSHVLHATRQYRLLFPNCCNNAAMNESR